MKNTYYASYMRSEKWLTFSKAIRNQRGNKCEFCRCSGEDIQLHCHHMTYERLGNEKPQDVIVLCKTHHKIYHSKYPSRNMPKLPVEKLRAHVLDTLIKDQNRKTVLSIEQSQRKAERKRQRKSGISNWERMTITQRRAARIIRARERVEKGVATPKEERRAKRKNSKNVQAAIEEILAKRQNDSISTSP